MKRNVTFFLPFILFFISLGGQNVETLRKKIQSGNDPDSLLKWYGLISVKFKMSNLDSGLFYGRKAVSLIKKNSNPRYSGLAYMALADAILYINGENGDALIYYKEAEKYLLPVEDNKQLAYVYTGMGSYWTAKNNPALSNSYFLKGIACFEKVKEYKAAIKLKMCCADNYINFNEYEKGIAMCYEVMRDKIYMKDSNAAAALYVTLGVAIRDSSISQSCYFLKLALKKYNLHNNFCNKGVQNLIITNGITMALLNLAENYKDLYLQTKDQVYLDQGRMFLNKFKNFYLENKADEKFTIYYILVGNYFLMDRKYDSCIYFSRQALASNRVGLFQIPAYDIDAYNNLSGAFLAKGRTDSAYHYLKKAYDVATKLRTDEIKRKMLDAETNYQIQKADAEMKNVKSQSALREKVQLEKLRKNQIIFITAIFLLAMFGLLTFFIVKNYTQKQRLKYEQFEKEKMVATLNSLKNQISPHIMFNTLNNILFSMDIDKKKAKNMIILFADLLRYQLYECDVDITKLESEIHYIKQYIELQKLRISDRCTLSINIQEESYNTTVAPLIFIALIENSFKYVSNNAGSENFIKIDLSVEPGYVSLCVQNTYHEIISEVKKENNGGLGLVNLKRRLWMLYPNKHELSIQKENNIYTTKLGIYVA